MSEPDPKLLAEMRGWRAGILTGDIMRDDGLTWVSELGKPRRDLVLLMARSWEAMRDAVEAHLQPIPDPHPQSTIPNDVWCEGHRKQRDEALSKALALARGEEE